MLEHPELRVKSLDLKAGSRSSTSLAKDFRYFFLIKGTGEVLFCFRKCLTL